MAVLCILSYTSAYIMGRLYVFGHIIKNIQAQRRL